MADTNEFPPEDGSGPDHVSPPHVDALKINELFSRYQECHPGLVWLRSDACGGLLNIPHSSAGSDHAGDWSNSLANADEQSVGCSIVRVIFVAQTTGGQRLVFRLDEFQQRVEQMLLLPQKYVAIPQEMEIHLRGRLLNLQNNTIMVLEEKNACLQRRLQSMKQYGRNAVYVALTAVTVALISNWILFRSSLTHKDQPPAVVPQGKPTIPKQHPVQPEESLPEMFQKLVPKKELDRVPLIDPNEPGNR